MRKTEEQLIKELAERDKELNFLYSISDIVDSHGKNINEIAGGIIKRLPGALQYPDIACAEINIKGEKIRTEPFRETEWQMSDQLKFEGRRVGEISVYYMEEKPGFDESPFLKEEEKLLKTLSERISKIIERIWSEEALVEKTKEIIKLSTPVTQIWNDILILPLIGTLDSERTLQMMEELLIKIRETGARFIIMDATGVGTIDSAVAANILKTSQAVKMLGSHMIFTGIKPEVAMTMVHLGIDLGDIITRATLQEGVEYALDEKGLAIVKKSMIIQRQ
ncbi:STAS domain-containing protein [Methanoplanus limicola]|uniref:Anti-sigma-factor antagonist n=1 Tax=Methanoplanus limicola DSM 2279 TaxID=937775 RepID=H1Z3D0_9EURY|nr:STAS domain-containing protein [Methanoplanus limicola]EHQ36545.1 anti-sigma-factor antagonist [Methanoplanus limicola DSM 2279]